MARIYYTRTLRRRRIRSALLQTVAAGAVAALVAAAGLALTGRAAANAEPVPARPLDLSDIHLRPQPGRPDGFDLVLSAANPNPAPLTVTAVAASAVLASPVGCATGLSGPLATPVEYRLPAAERVTVPPRGQRRVVVHGALLRPGPAECALTADVTVAAG